MSSYTETISKSIRSSTDQLLDIREFVEQAAREFGFGDEESSNIVLAVDEACTNVIKHAYAGSPSGEIRVTILREGTRFQIQIQDHGRTFDPETLRPPDLKQQLTHYRRGGLGVYLMRRLMDRVEYAFRPGQPNEVRLTKFLARPAAGQRG